VSDDGRDAVLTVVNLDPYNAQDASLDLGDRVARNGVVVDELSGETFRWPDSHPYVRLVPQDRVAHIFDLNPDGL
jgi:hypothetical protein